MTGPWGIEPDAAEAVAVDDRLTLMQKFCDVDRAFTDLRRDIEDQQKKAAKLEAERNQLRQRLLVALGAEPPEPAGW